MGNNTIFDARKDFKQWSKMIKKEITRLQKAGDLSGAGYLANLHAKELIKFYSNN